LGIGYAPGGNLHRHLATLGYSFESLLDIGLINTQGRDAFCGRVIFPCRRHGQVINLYGRSVGTAFPHRLLSSSKGGLVARESVCHSSSVILVEEFFDLAVLWQAGFSEHHLRHRCRQAKVRQQDDGIVPFALRALFICAHPTDLMSGTKVVRPELMQGLTERMSLTFLTDTIDRCSGLQVVEFTRFFFENLVLSQHFSVAARRFDGETQRLRIGIEEEGLEFLADEPLVPFVTPDRLATTLSLMADCGLLQWDDKAKGHTNG
jgi:hypothetical protein